MTLIPFTLAIANVRFGNQYGELTLLMKMQIPQSGNAKNKELLFGATDIKPIPAIWSEMLSSPC